MRRKTYVLSLAMLVAGLLALSGVAQSAMWVGAELGGNFPGSTTKFTVNNQAIDNSGTNIYGSVIGGAMIGYDFVNSGFGAYAWPDWMKYFSFATDITYNRLVIEAQGGGIASILPSNARLNGYCITWSFLFMAHYGFMPDTEVPTGRIVPYIGVGPAILFTGSDFSVNAFRNRVTPLTNTRFSTSATNVALVVEPGIRWMALKNVSVDTAFRWRYAVPSWGNDFVTVKADPLHQFSFLLRANYHF
jgi:hypothetical protein